MHLLVATGGSRHSEIAVRAGLGLAFRVDAEVTLLFVVKNQAGRATALRTLDSLCAQSSAKKLRIRRKVRVGRVLPALYDELRERPADLLVLGERIPHRLLTRIRGSVVARVASSAPCPVLIAKRADIPLSHVLICDSGAAPPTVFDGLTAHGMLPFFTESAITVLHVMSQISAGPGVQGRQLRAGFDDLIQAHAPEGELLARDLALLQGQGLSAAAKVRHGLVVDEILAEATEGDHGLIVIGGHRTGGWPALLLDDLAHQIVTRLDRSLLVVR